MEFDLRYAVPLGFYHAVLNFGISGSFIFPWGRGFLNTSSYLSERFFLGGNSSLICTLRGPTSILGFNARSLGPAEPSRQERGNSNNESSYASTGMDFIGGDLAATAFADLSFDLSLWVFREPGIHGHAFAVLEA
ncbi:Outer membrane OMP85 family protein [Forsythia ovata]|uniref:Outer membrane OMP85 family protein n=1 Tax=Forsythia ovata TaxID=205694 RepID=A0ABD1UC56_9LAMI